MARKPESIDLNRTLPTIPANDLSPISSRSPSPGLHSVHAEDTRHKTRRILQPASSKQQLQSVTHKLLTQGSPPYSRQNPSDFESVDPVKFIVFNPPLSAAHK
ncbi:MAG: hypothetical protein L6R40_005793 [Gallowayella cf. fulva]|nr:MAG: hypothetical protein L6R40_005793 [Xanthomendoza cf. fulva]